MLVGLVNLPHPTTKEILGERAILWSSTDTEPRPKSPKQALRGASHGLPYSFLIPTIDAWRDLPAGPGPCMEVTRTE